MVDKEEAMQEVKESFGKFLSLWSDYFEEEDNDAFITRILPFAENLYALTATRAAMIQDNSADIMVQEPTTLPPETETTSINSETEPTNIMEHSSPLLQSEDKAVHQSIPCDDSVVNDAMKVDISPLTSTYDTAQNVQPEQIFTLLTDLLDMVDEKMKQHEALVSSSDVAQSGEIISNLDNTANILEESVEKEKLPIATVTGLAQPLGDLHAHSTMDESLIDNAGLGEQFHSNADIQLDLTMNDTLDQEVSVLPLNDDIEPLVNEELSSQNPEHLKDELTAALYDAPAPVSMVIEEAAPVQPNYFPSLFGRSINRSLSPIKSPEKYHGIHKAIYKDLFNSSDVILESSDDEMMEFVNDTAQNEDYHEVKNYVIAENHEEELNVMDEVDAVSKTENFDFGEAQNHQESLDLMDVHENFDVNGTENQQERFDVMDENDDVESGPVPVVKTENFDTTETQNHQEGMVMMDILDDDFETNPVVKSENVDTDTENHHDDFDLMDENIEFEMTQDEVAKNENLDPDEPDQDIEMSPIVVAKDESGDAENVQQPFHLTIMNDAEILPVKIESSGNVNICRIIPTETPGIDAANLTAEANPEILEENLNSDEEQGQGDDVAAKPRRKKSGNVSTYVLPLQNPDDFLISGRADGASEHFFPALQSQKAIELLASQGDLVAEEVVPYSMRPKNDPVEEHDSKPVLKEIMKTQVVESHRLSLEDVVNRHKEKPQEVIVIDSDAEDNFNTTAQEIILDTDEGSYSPCPVQVHASLTKVLKKHQIEGVSFLYKCLIGKVNLEDAKVNTGAILAHCMGLGKTLQVITFLHTIMTHSTLKKGIKRVLILCPAGLVPNWVREFQKWLGDLDRSLDTLKVYGISSDGDWSNHQQVLNKWARTSSSVVIMPYGLFRNSFDKLKPHTLTSPGPCIMVCDESHILNKNPKCQLFKCVRQVKTTRRICLTGTPIQNALHEYYYALDFVAPGLCGTLQEFKKKFIQPIDAATTIEASDSDAEIMKKRACILFKKMEIVMHRQNFSVLAKILPEKKEFVLFLRLSDVQKQLYERFMNLKKNSGMLAQNRVFDDQHTAYRIISYPYLVKTMAKKKPSAEDEKLGDWYSDILNSFNCKANDYESGVKFRIVVKMLKWFEKLGEKCIIFHHSLESLGATVKMLESKASTWFSDNHPGDRTWSWKRDKDYYLIQGNTPAHKRLNLINSFNDPNNKRGRLFLCSDAGITGNNMVGASRVIIFDSKHNPSDEIQAMFRAYRIGQTRVVHVYRLVGQGSMEDWIVKRQIIKLQNQARILDNEGVKNSVKKNDISELLRFLPADKDIDFTKQPNYKSSGDKEFDDFCLENRNDIVELCDHESMMSFNEEEKLSVIEDEWEKHVKGYSLQDEVFNKIQKEEEAMASPIVDSDDKSASSISTHPSTAQPSSSVIIIDDDESTATNSNHPSASQASHLNVAPFPQFNIVRPRPPIFMASNPDRQTTRIYRLNSPASRIILQPRITQMHIPRVPSLPMPHYTPRAQTVDVKPRILYSTQSQPSAGLKRPFKREISPEIICLSDDENTEPRPKIPKPSKSPFSQRQSKK